MSKHWSSSGFSDLSERLARAVQWLQGFGVRTDGTRLAHYHRAIRDLTVASDRADPAELKAMWPQVANALYEANEYATIHRSFADGRHDAFVSARLEALAGGPLFYADENSSSGNRPRNLMFELLVGARLVDSGLGLVASDRSDVESSIEQMRLVIECKRPQTEAKVERRAKDARDQLLAKLPDGAIALGIVALDLTKLTNPKFDLLVRMPAEAGTEALANYLIAFFHRRSELFARIASQYVVALLLRISILAHLTGEPSPTYCQQWTLVQLHSAGQRARRAISALNQALQLGTEKDG
jgi:hypothetical protein